MSEKIKVVLVEPGRAARVAEIGSELEDMQAVVGGLIEAVWPFDGSEVLVCNEEGKLIGLPFNRLLRDAEGTVIDILCGNFFICSASESSFESLDEAQMEKYLEMFKYPEVFTVFNGRLTSFRIDPESGKKI